MTTLGIIIDSEERKLDQILKVSTHLQRRELPPSNACTFSTKDTVGMCDYDKCT